MTQVNSKSGFESPKDWERFSTDLTSTNRFVIKARWKRFLNTLRKTAVKRTADLEKNRTLVRARIGSRWEEYEDKYGVPQIYFGPLSIKELGAPSKEETRDGRANPKGIPYLYLSTKVRTAIAEVRPWIKADVSVDFWKTRRRLKILDLTKDNPLNPISETSIFSLVKIERKYAEEEIDAYVWGDINRAFSLPIQPGLEEKHYIPTQHIAEFFKNRGYQGIAYKSSVDEEGYNIVLFNPSYARLIGAQSFEVSKIIYETKENANGYSVRKRRTRKVPATAVPGT